MFRRLISNVPFATLLASLTWKDSPELQNTVDGVFHGGIPFLVAIWCERVPASSPKKWGYFRGLVERNQPHNHPNVYTVGIGRYLWHFQRAEKGESVWELSF